MLDSKFKLLSLMSVWIIIFFLLESISGISIIVMRVGFNRAIGINECVIFFDGFTDEIILYDVGSGHGAA